MKARRRIGTATTSGPRRKGPMAKKLAISFEAPLAAEVHRAAARETAGNVSAWLAQAARQRLRLIAGRELLAEYESEDGSITEEELREVRKRWPKD